MANKKVETLGDGVYMVAGGVPDKCDDHAEKVAGLALELVENAVHVRNPVTGKGMHIRIGMHTGSVVAGIVGKRTPQYCLFGDTVNTAARMQTNSEPGRIHLTEPCHECLKTTDFVSVYRGRIQVKGKGEMKTYWLAGRRGQESTRAMCHTIREEHRLHRQRSLEQSYDHHAMHTSTSAANFMAMADVTEQDEQEFQDTLAAAFVENMLSSEDDKTLQKIDENSSVNPKPSKSKRACSKTTISTTSKATSTSTVTTINSHNRRSSSSISNNHKISNRSSVTTPTTISTTRQGIKPAQNRNGKIPAQPTTTQTSKKQLNGNRQ